MRKRGITGKIILTVGILLSVTLALVFYTVIRLVVENEREHAIDKMKSSAIDRARLVEEYVQGRTDFVLGYSKGSEIKNVLLDPDNQEKIDAAREYTNRYAEAEEYIEGLYVSKWDTYVIAHTNPDSVDKVFREGDSLKELQAELVRHDDSFCSGIVTAPVTKKQVMPSYKKITDDNGNPIGFVGVAFYTSDLKSALDMLSDTQNESEKYMLIDATNNVFIFNELDEDMVGRECTDTEMLAGIAEIKKSDNKGYSFFESATDSIYSGTYMKDRNWIFLICDTEDTIFSDISMIRSMLVSIGIISIILCFAVLLQLLSSSLRPFKPIGAAIKKLETEDYDIEELISPLEERGDEFGNISRMISKLGKAMVDKSEIYSEMLKAQGNGLLSIAYDTDDIVLMNSAAMDMLDIDSGWVPQNTQDLYFMLERKGEGNAEAFTNMVISMKENENDKDYEYKLVVNGQVACCVLARGKVLELSTGREVLIMSMTDITDKKAIEEKLKNLSECDALTGIYNRRRGSELYYEALENQKVGIFCLFDINKFKEVNDTYGHQAGDGVLMGIAATMRKIFRKNDICIRLGGDEFVAFISGVEDKKIAEKIINRFLREIEKMYIPNIGDRKISVSLGAVACKAGDEFDAVYEKADSLMYNCKQEGGSSYKFAESK